MTVIVGIYCEDGVVIGADSSMTFTGAAPQLKTIEQEAKKVFTLGEDLVFATAGSVGLTQRFQDVLAKAKGDFKKQSELDAAKVIARKTLEDFASTFLNPGQLGALVGFSCANGIRLVEFAVHDFQPEIKNAGMWFCTMGSGQPLTDPFLAFVKRALFKGTVPKLREGVFVAYWALQHAIELNTGGIQGPPQIATLTKSAGRVVARLLKGEDFGEPHGMVGGIEEHLGLYRQQLSGIRPTPAPGPPQPEPPAPAKTVSDKPG